MSMQFGDPRLPQKFWARHEVTVNAGMSPCWTWTSFKGLGPNNRTIALFGREKPTTNYRFTCDLEHGPLPEGMTCSHTCHNPLCANPDHIVYESIGDNIKRGTHMQHPRATEIFDAKRNANPAFNRSVVTYNKRHNALSRKCNEKRYHNDPEYRAKQIDRINKRQKERRRTDPVFREKQNAYSRDYGVNYRAEHNASLNKQQKERYNNDPEYREKVKAAARARYHAKKANKTA